MKWVMIGGSSVNADASMVPVSPSLVWRGSLPRYARIVAVSTSIRLAVLGAPADGVRIVEGEELVDGDGV
jgi:hypothetical protein